MRVPFDEKVWSGRCDVGEPGNTRRVFSQVTRFAGERLADNTPVIVGFGSDEGVRRNQGRIGAAPAPKELWRALAGLPAKALPALHDAGDVVCDDGDLDAAQDALGHVVAEILACGGRPLVFGGGHEVAWGTYSGLHAHRGEPETAERALPDRKLRCPLRFASDASCELPARAATLLESMANAVVRLTSSVSSVRSVS
jgi:formiminoglutamase